MNKKHESTCVSPSEKPEWMNLKLTNVIEKLGAPSVEEEFNMKDAVITEFRGKLEQLFPRASIGSENVFVKEVTWEQGECNLALWFKKSATIWQVVDTLEWHKDTEF